MFSKNIQVTEPSKEKIHYDDSKKKTNAPWVYIGVIRPVKTAVTQRPTTDNLQNWENLEHSVLNGMLLSNPSPQGSGICKEREAEKF